MESFEGSLGFHDNFYSMHTIKGWEVDVHPFWRQFDVFRNFVSILCFSRAAFNWMVCEGGQLWLAPALIDFSHGSRRRPNLASMRERPRAELKADIKMSRLRSCKRVSGVFRLVFLNRISVSHGVVVQMAPSNRYPLFPLWCVENYSCDFILFTDPTSFLEIFKEPYLHRLLSNLSPSRCMNVIMAGALHKYGGESSLLKSVIITFVPSSLSIWILFSLLHATGSLSTSRTSKEQFLVPNNECCYVGSFYISQKPSCLFQVTVLEFWYGSHWMHEDDSISSELEWTQKEESFIHFIPLQRNFPPGKVSPT